jgi:hypothetical protein
MTVPNENQDDLLNTNENENMPVAGNSNAAKFNAQEQADVVNDKEFIEYTEDKNLDTGASAQPDPSTDPLTLQGDYNEKEENMGGTTNLTLDQLKKERDPEGDDAERLM